MSIAAAGSILVLIQNLLLLSGLAILVTSRSLTGSYVFSFSLYLDLIGISLMGLGLLSLTFGEAVHESGASRPFWTPARLGVMSGALCFVWVVFTVAWRIVGLGAIGASLDTASGLLPESEDSSSAASSLFVQIRTVAAVWMLASLALAFSSMFFAFFLKGRFGEGRSSVAWPFFCILNAAATVFIGAVIIALAGGEMDFPLIAVAAFLKLGAVPAVGVAACGSLSWKLMSLSRA